MAWQDILGGLAGGLSQGLGQVQQNVESSRRNDQVNKEMALRALQERRAMEAEQRRVLLEQFGLMEEGAELDPTNPDQAAMVTAAGPGAFIKSPTGKLAKKKSIATQTAELNYQDALANQPIKAGDRASALKKQQFQTSAFGFLEKKYGPDWVDRITTDMDVKDRGLAGTALMGNQEAFLRQDEVTSAINARTSAGAQLGSARLYTGGAGGNGKPMTENERFDNQLALEARYQSYLAAKGMAGQMARNELRDKFGGNREAHKAAYAATMNLGAGPAAAGGWQVEEVRK